LVRMTTSTDPAGFHPNKRWLRFRRDLGVRQSSVVSVEFHFTTRRHAATREKREVLARFIIAVC
jgi:hypothetical protein